MFGAAVAGHENGVRVSESGERVIGRQREPVAGPNPLAARGADSEVVAGLPCCGLGKDLPGTAQVEGHDAGERQDDETMAYSIDSIWLEID